MSAHTALLRQPQQWRNGSAMLRVTAVCFAVLVTLVLIQHRQPRVVLESSSSLSGDLDDMQSSVYGKKMPSATAQPSVVLSAANMAPFAKAMADAVVRIATAEIEAKVDPASLKKSGGDTKHAALRRGLKDGQLQAKGLQMSKGPSLRSYGSAGVSSSSTTPPNGDHRSQVNTGVEAARHGAYKTQHNGNVIKDTIGPSDAYERPTQYYDTKGYKNDYKKPYSASGPAAAQSSAYKTQHRSAYSGGSGRSGASRGGRGAAGSGSGYTRGARGAAGGSSGAGGSGRGARGAAGGASGGRGAAGRGAAGRGAAGRGGVGGRGMGGAGVGAAGRSLYDPKTGRFRGEYDPATGKYEFDPKTGQYNGPVGGNNRTIGDETLGEEKFHRHVQDPWKDPVGLFSRNPAQTFPYFYAEGRHWDKYSPESPPYDWDEVLEHGRMLKPGKMAHGKDKTWSDIPDSQWGWEHQFANWDPEGADNDALVFGSQAAVLARDQQEKDPLADEKPRIGGNPWELSWIAGPRLEGDAFMPLPKVEPKFHKPVRNEFGNLGEHTAKNNQLVFGDNQGLLAQQTTTPIEKNWAIQDSMVPPDAMHKLLAKRGFGPTAEVSNLQRYGNHVHPFSDYWKGYNH